MTDKFYLGKHFDPAQNKLSDQQLQYDPADLTMHAVVNDVNELPILPKKTDVYVDLFGVAWMPYYLVKSADQTLEISAFV